MTGVLEQALRARRDEAGHAFVPYVTGGFPGVDADLLRGIQDAGADAVEVGIPFSDPVMDGGVIQEASRLALEAGTHPRHVLSVISDAALTIPVAVMTYVNPVYRRGVHDFFREASAAGVSGVILPDVPVDEAVPFEAAARAHGIDAVLLAAPGTEPARMRLIAERAHGFVYCVGTYGVTGARDRLAGSARDVVGSLRPLTDLPLLVGVGIATPALAAEACAFADGVIVGSALMACMLEGDRDGMLKLAAAFRAAIPVTFPGA